MLNILSSLALLSVVAGCGGRTAYDEGGRNPESGARPVEPVTSIDILFMVGNWRDLSDEQALLAEAVPQLLNQLLRPNCIAGDGTQLGLSTFSPTGVACAEGQPEFRPINDIHIGVITSSLGDHGTYTLCTPGLPSIPYISSNGELLPAPDDVNDKAHLMGTLARGAQALDADTKFTRSSTVRLDSAGFLDWAPSLDGPQPRQGDLDSLSAGFADMVTAAQTEGCGLEAQLESWFRFLIDPVPPILPIAAPDSNQLTHRTGSDDVLLAQRAAFLRPNSLLSIVMLSDENDFSVRDENVGWVSMMFSTSITTGSPTCATKPNDRCCYSCTSAAPTGCDACPNVNSAADDNYRQVALRGYHQKRRFGYDFMYPVSRYYVGLTHPELCPDQTFGDMDCDCTYAKSINAACSAGSRRMPNPLFSHVVGTDNQGQPVQSLDVTNPTRKDSSNIILAGIVGVPWEDLATEESQAPGVPLEYIPTTDPRWTSENGIWKRIYGDDAANIVPGDPHMVESPVPRDGIAGVDAAPWSDPASSHEYTSGRYDLQYACVAPLKVAKPCPCSATDRDYLWCWYQHFPSHCCNLTAGSDALGDPTAPYNDPMCQNSDTGTYDFIQYNDKAYPGVREIAVLHDFGLGPTTYKDRRGTGNAVVASICPKDVTSAAPAALGYGYNPAMNALFARMKEHLPKN